MSGEAKEILEKALTMGEDDRAYIAERLFDSLQPEDDEGVEEAWRAEIHRRSEEVKSGKVKPKPWTQVREELMASLRAAD